MIWDWLWGHPSKGKRPRCPLHKFELRQRVWDRDAYVCYGGPHEVNYMQYTDPENYPL